MCLPRSYPQSPAVWHHQLHVCTAVSLQGQTALSLPTCHTHTHTHLLPPLSVCVYCSALSAWLSVQKLWGPLMEVFFCPVKFNSSLFNIRAWPVFVLNTWIIPQIVLLMRVCCCFTLREQMHYFHLLDRKTGEKVPLRERNHQEHHLKQLRLVCFDSFEIKSLYICLKIVEKAHKKRDFYIALGFMTKNSLFSKCNL